MIYFSKTTGGFYNDGIHDSIPPDAVEVTEDEHAALLNGQASGHQITGDANGNPILVAPPVKPLTVLQQISVLEAQVTPRRIRDAVLTGDKSFIQEIDYKIAALRVGVSA